MPTPPAIYYQACNIVRYNQIWPNLPFRAEAQLTYQNLNSGSSANSRIHPPGFKSGGCPHHHHRGHLIGRQLGGPGGEYFNLVTLMEASNSDHMLEFERKVVTYLTTHRTTIFTYVVIAFYGPVHLYDQNHMYFSFPAPIIIRMWLTRPITQFETPGIDAPGHFLDPEDGTDPLAGKPRGVTLETNAIRNDIYHVHNQNRAGHLPECKVPF